MPSASLANGLAVPFPFAMDTIIQVLKESGGETCSISEAEIISSVKQIAAEEGVLVSPEGAAAWKGVVKLLQQQKIDPAEKILVLNTGSGYKYLENIV